MLDRLQIFARSLYRFRPLLFVLAMISLGYGTHVMLTSRSQGEDIYFIPTLVLFAWSVMLYSFASLFVTLPPAPERQMKRLRRIGLRLRRLAYWLFAVLMLGVTATLLVMSWQLASAWRMMF